MIASLSLIHFGYGAICALRNSILACVLAAGVAQADPMTLVALGDSLTQGYGLPPEQGLVPQLEGWLRAQGADVVVQNAGVSGDTTAGGLSRLDWSLGPDADALMVILGGNDLLRGLDPAVTRANLAAILDGARARGLPVLLVGMQAPGNYGADYKAAFDAIYPDLAATGAAVFVPSFFGLMTGGAAVEALGADAARLMQPDGIHPSAEGVARVVQALGPQVLILLDAAPAR